MSRTLLCLAGLLCMISSIVDAQLVRSYGLKAGTAAANQNWEYASLPASLDTRTRWGLDIGAFVEWLNMPTFSVLSEVHYVQKGFKTEIPVTTEQFPEGNGTYLSFSPVVHYLSIPIMAKGRIDIGSATVYGFAGPRVDVLLSEQGDAFDAVVKNFKGSEFGASLGVGLETAQLGHFVVGLEFRYSPTFQDSYSTSLLSVRNRSMEMLIVIGT